MDPILDRFQKLVCLATNNPNVEEARSAALKAVTMIVQHKLVVSGASTAPPIRQSQHPGTYYRPAPVPNPPPPRQPETDAELYERVMREMRENARKMNEEAKRREQETRDEVLRREFEVGSSNFSFADLESDAFFGNWFGRKRKA